MNEENNLISYPFSHETKYEKKKSYNSFWREKNKNKIKECRKSSKCLVFSCVKDFQQLSQKSPPTLVQVLLTTKPRQSVTQNNTLKVQ